MRERKEGHKLDQVWCGTSSFVAGERERERDKTRERIIKETQVFPSAKSLLANSHPTPSLLPRLVSSPLDSCVAEFANKATSRS